MKYLLMLLLVACSSPTDVFAVSDALTNATEFTPPEHFRELWQRLESCSGLHRDYAHVRWYRSPSLVVQDHRSAGVYLAGINSIVLPEYSLAAVPNHDVTISHEEMHALLRGIDGHPAEYFNGVCGWLAP